MNGKVTYYFFNVTLRKCSDRNKLLIKQVKSDVTFRYGCPSVCHLWESSDTCAEFSCSRLIVGVISLIGLLYILLKAENTKITVWCKNMLFTVPNKTNFIAPKTENVEQKMVHSNQTKRIHTLFCGKAPEWHRSTGCRNTSQRDSLTALWWRMRTERDVSAPL